MSGGHPSSSLFVEGDSVVHRLPPQCKVLATLGFVLAVVSTPREQVWAFAAHATVLGLVAAAAAVPAATIARRTLVETPFVAFALLLPFVSGGERMDLLGLEVSEPGIAEAWNILVKATLGVVASILLAATTEPRSLVHGLARLRTPGLVVQIMTFMVRYIDVVQAQLSRMRIAQQSRGFVARDVRQLGAVGRSAASLFVRSYERGERVHLAMLSRGYTGVVPGPAGPGPTRGEWWVSATVPVTAVGVALLAWTSSR